MRKVRQNNDQWAIMPYPNHSIHLRPISRGTPPTSLTIVTTTFEHLLDSAQKLRAIMQPELAVQLGTGQSHSLDQLLEQPSRYSYNEVFTSALPSALSHRGEVIMGTIKGSKVVVFAGRLHLYEGHSAYTICQQVILAKLLGCTTLFFNNAAGALRSSFNRGEIVMINDHLNLTGENPLINVPTALAKHWQLEHPFVDMSDAYSPKLNQHLAQIATDAHMTLKPCIYAGIKGPSLETSAERRMLASLGADVVGMSTVNEVIMSRYLGLETVALCTITNMATGEADQQPDTIESILAFADRGGQQLSEIIALYCAGRASNQQDV